MIELDITMPPNRAPKEWDEECRGLYLELKASIDEGEVEAKPPAGIAEHRSIGTLFSHLIMVGTNLGVFSAVFEVLKSWLDNRPSCEITLTCPDGTVLKISKLSLDEAMKLYEQHAMKPALATAGSTEAGNP
jgi:hypothetical protein